MLGSLRQKKKILKFHSVSSVRVLQHLGCAILSDLTCATIGFRLGPVLLKANFDLRVRARQKKATLKLANASSIRLPGNQSSREDNPR
jgi:hypothetical protein